MCRRRIWFMSASQGELATIRTPDQRLRVFVSSTLKELAAERQAARSAVERLHLSPVMFELGARPHPPRQLYRAYLQQSDVFVGLYWERYGWVAPGEQVSGLEDEYNLAGDLPKLIYIKEPVSAREARLQELLDRVRDDDGTSFKYFSTGRELRRLLEADLATLLAERFEESRRDRAASPSAGVPALPPAPLSGLIGRQAEVQAVESLLTRESVRLVTLIGPGGIGKTRLAIAVAAKHLEETDDETAFVDLSTLNDASRVPNAIAEAVGVNDTGDEPVDVKLRSALRSRHMVIVLDNFEVVLGAGPTVTALLSSVPDLTILVTSRTRLHVSGEHIFDVEPLGLPPARSPDEAALTPNALLDSPSVALFVERARAVKPDFELTLENADAVAAICIALDGVPLALELAAARIRTLAPVTMLARFDRRLSLLADSRSDRPARQQTLRSTIEWSTQQLGEEENVLLAELGVFSGLFTLEAVEAVSQSPVDADLLSHLDALVDGSLVREHDRAGLSYFSMLATVREYAIERLEERGLLQSTRARHASYYVSWGERTEAAIAEGRQAGWIARLDDERDNVRAAMRFLLDSRDWEAAMRLVWSLRLYWWVALLHGEVSKWTDEVLAAGDGVTGRTRAIALEFTGGMALMQNPNADAIAALSECVDLFHADGDLTGEGLSRNLLATALMLSGAVDGARIDDALTTSLRLLREAHDSWGQVMVLVALGQVSMMRGDVRRSLELFQESLDLAGPFGEGFVSAYAVMHLGWARLAGGDLDAASDAFVEGLSISGGFEHTIGVANAFDGLVAVAAAQGDYERAARLLGASESTWKRAGQFNARSMSLGRLFLDPILADERMARMEQARREGNAMSTDEAISFALGEGKSAITANAGSSARGPERR